MEQTSYIILTFSCYFIVMLGIGLYSWKLTVSSSDYFLAGRQLGPWTSALSAGASDMSGWLLLGLPGFVFIAGLNGLWLSSGLLIGSWLNWLIVAKRLRVFSYLANDSLTLPEYFANRFEDAKGLIEPISAIFILVFFLFYTSSGLVAGGKLFEAAFGLDYHLALVIGVVSVISYTLFGGFLAVCWTDLVQGLLMSTALVVVPIVAIDSMGGISTFYQSIIHMDANFMNPFIDESGKKTTWLAILSLLGWGVGYFGQPHILARFKATKSSKDLNIARRIAISWTFLSMLGAILVGLTGLIYVQNQGISISDPENIFILLCNVLFHPAISGILLAAILAAIMSTADSQLLVCSAAFTEDLYLRWFRVNASQKELLMIGRISVIVVAILATWFAWDPHSSVLDLVSYAWAGFGAAFGPVILFSLYWKRINSSGAMAGIVTGSLTIFLWPKFQEKGGIFELYELIPGFLFASIAIVIFSYMGKKPSEKVLNIFDQVVKER